MNKFKELQKKHLALLEKYRKDQSSEELIADVEAYIEEVKIAGKEISASRERDQLRANLRFWGAFIFEQKNVFPDTNLWPSAKRRSEGRLSYGKTFPAAIGILGMLILVGCLVISALILIPQQRARQSEQSTLASQNALISGALTATSMAFSLSHTPEVTRTDMPSTTPEFIDLTPSPTSPSIYSPTPVPTETPPVGYTPPPTATLISMPITPVAGGPKTDIQYQEANCSSRTLMINTYDKFLVREPVIATLLAPATGEIIARRAISEDEHGFGSTVIALENPIENTTYLLLVKNSFVQYEMTIVQFLSNCTRNNMTVTLTDPVVVSEEPFDSELILVTWGSGYGENLWLAKFRIKNSGTGIFWFVDSRNQTDQPAQLVDDTFIIKGNYCEAAKFTIIETTDGIYKEQGFSLFSPMSFCP